MSNDYTQQMIEYILGMSEAGQPYDPGPYEGEPAGITAEMQRRTNLYQDQLSTQSDLANAALMGPEAFAPGAFDPTSTYTRVDQPGTQALRALAQRTNTPAGMIAYGILQGSTAGAEIAKLQQMYEEAEADGSLATDPILSQIPKKPDDIDGTTMLPDWMGLQMQMGDVESKYMSESSGASNSAMYDPTTGEYLGGGNQQMVLDANGNPTLADVETTPSEAAQWYADQGLSPPDQQYTAADLLGPDYQGSQDYTDALSEQLISLLQNDPSVVLPPTGKDQYASTTPTWAKPGGDVAAAAAPVTEDSNGFSDFWANAQPGSFADRLKGVGAVAGPAAEEVGSWFQSLFRDTAAGPQTVTGTTGTDLYGLPTTSSTGGGFESIPADVGQAGLTDINAVVGPDSVTAQGIDNWLSGLWAGAQSAASGDWLGAISDASGNALDRVTGGHSIQDQLDDMSPDEIAAIIGGDQAAGGQQYSPGGSADPWAGMTLEQQQAAVQANPVMQTPAWQSILQQSMQQAIQGTGDYDVGDRMTVGQSGSTARLPRRAGGQPSPPPAPGQYNVPGQAPVNPNVSGPPMPTATQAGDPQLQAMLAQIMGGGIDANTLAGMQQQSAAQSQPNPQQQQQIMGQRPAGALGSPAWQSLLMQSINARGRNLLPPSQNERNQILGQTPQQPQGGGVLGIGDYLNTYVMGGGTQPHAGAPPQPSYSPLPGNPSQPTDAMRAAMLGTTAGTGTPSQGGGVLGIGDYLTRYVMGGGTQPHAGAPPQQPPPFDSVSPEAGRGTTVGGTLSDRLGTTSQAPEDQWWYNNQMEPAAGRGPTQTMDEGTRAAWNAIAQQGRGIQTKSWWQQNMTPSWWSQIGGGNRDAGDGTPVRIGEGKKSQQRLASQPSTPHSSGFASPSDSPERRQWFSDTQAVLNERARDKRENYGYDYGRAAAAAYLLRQRGITPATTQIAARRATAASRLGM